MATPRTDPDERFCLPLRAVKLELLSGRDLYERVVMDLVGRATQSVWIATANLKELLVEPPEGRPRLRKSAKMVGAARRERSAKSQGDYVSVFEHFAHLSERGVSVRVLHSGVPSTAFAQELIAHRSLLTRRGSEGEPTLALRRCPRVHLKTVISDATHVYLGSANWTGAGLGAKGAGRRNFELGMVTDDDHVLDQVQSLYERIWSGRACKGCRLRPQCPQPIDELVARSEPR